MIFHGYPGFLPGLVVAGVLTVIVARPLATALSIRPALSAALTLAAGVVVAATLFPDVLGIEPAPPTAAGWTCDVTRLRPSIGELLELGESTANVALFVPLGIVLALLPRRHRRLAIPMALVGPFAIELIQMVVPALHRTCQTADIADNVSGLIVGLILGTAARLAVRRRWADGARD